LDNGKLVSVVPGLTVYGPFQQLVTDWFQFATNVTDATGNLRKFQPFADVRWRLAVADSVNMTDVNININNRLGQAPNNLIPPGTAPEGAYNPAIKPRYSYDLAKMTQLITDACENPLTSFVDPNGHPYLAGTIDNSCSPSNPRLVEIYVGAGDTFDQKILSIMIGNLNRITTKLGVTFSIVPVPGGQYYTLSSKHLLYMTWAGWIADYNHVIDWLVPMLQPSGTYPAQNYLNYTVLGQLYNQAVEADQKGDVAGLLAINKQMQQFANDAVMYVYIDYPLLYSVRSSFMQGYFFNAATGIFYFATVSYVTSI
jgi:ABC-type oligopeptide transport system substrate-binding subunit